MHSNEFTQTTLELGNKYLAPDGARVLADTLKKNCSIAVRNLVGGEGIHLLMNALEENDSITELWLAENDLGDTGLELLANILKKNHMITKLQLSRNKIGPQGAGFLADALKNNHTITQLGLAANNLGPTGVEFLANALTSNHSITELGLAGNQLDPEGIRFLADALKNNNTITSLRLGDKNIGPKGVAFLADALEKNSSITTLSLDNSSLGPEGTRQLASALNNNHTITTLSLTNNDIGVEGVYYLADALKNNSTITTLKLDGNDITDTAAAHLINALNSNSVNICLTLGNNDIGRRDTCVLGNALKNNSTITTLDLSDNKLYDHTVSFLADALKENHTLTTLVLGHNKIYDEGAGFLADALKKNHSLTTLILYRNKIRFNGARSLVNALKENYAITTLNLQYNYSTDVKEIEKLVARNQAIAHTRKTILADISNTETKLHQKTSKKEIEALLNQISDTIDTLKGYNIQTSIAKHEITVYENALHDLIVQAHLQADDIASALLQYNTARTSHSAFLLAEYLFANKLSGYEDKKKGVYSVLYLLREAWTVPEAQSLTAKVAYSLYHSDDNIMDSLEASCQTVFGVDKVIPLSVIEESISTAERLSDEEREEHWKRIKQHLPHLSPHTLYQICQLSLLADVLQQKIGTQQVTSFFHLSTYQSEYPLSSQENKVSLSDLVANLKQDTCVTTTEERIQKNAHPLEKKDSLKHAFNDLIGSLKTARVQKGEYPEDSQQHLNITYYNALMRMKADSLEGKLLHTKLPTSLQSFCTDLYEKLKNIQEGYDEELSYANDYQVCVTIATSFLEQLSEYTKQKQSSLFTSLTEIPYYKELVDFIRTIKTKTFLDEIASQQMCELSVRPGSYT